MRYYLIAGEASGDLHASNLMRALQAADHAAEFRFFGGDAMQAVGGTMVHHYRELAYMGFIQVALHARPILKGMRQCKEDVMQWHPDALILIDYPGFNLQIARFIHSHTDIPVWYYISPKIWAWKKNRIRNIQRDVDELFSILPFEVPFFARHGYAVRYVGNPCADAVATYNSSRAKEDNFRPNNNLGDKPLVALLAGSRKAEINDNLPQMLAAMEAFPDVCPVIAGAPALERSLYDRWLIPYNAAHPDHPATLVFDATYKLLDHATAALVTSGTATLETALFRVPQVVCYRIRCGRFVSILRKLFLKVPFISLVNLIAGHEVVPELVAGDMTIPKLIAHLRPLLADTPERKDMLAAYDEIIAAVGTAGCSQAAASQMIALLNKEKTIK